jgi:hypothetical protein
MCIKSEGKYLFAGTRREMGGLSKRLPVTAALGALIGSSIIRGLHFFLFRTRTYIFFFFSLSLSMGLLFSLCIHGDPSKAIG